VISTASIYQPKMAEFVPVAQMNRLRSTQVLLDLVANASHEIERNHNRGSIRQALADGHVVDETNPSRRRSA